MQSYLLFYTQPLMVQQLNISPLLGFLNWVARYPGWVSIFRGIIQIFKKWFCACFAV